MQTILAARSDFSIGESILTVEQIVDLAKAAGQRSVAITDTMSITCLIDFSNKAKKAGVKPIIGCRIRLVDDPTWRKTKGVKSKPQPEFYVTWYVLSEKGLLALFKLLSLANSDARFYNNAKVGFDDLYAALDSVTADDVAIASSDAFSVVGHKQAALILSEIARRVSAQNTFLTLTPMNTPLWDTLNAKAIELARELNLPTLVTRPCAYPAGQAEALTVMGAVTSNTLMSSMWCKDIFNDDMHPMDQERFKIEVINAAKRLRQRDPASLTAGFVDGINNTDRLADMVTYVWKKAPISLPKMAPDEFAGVVALCKTGWSKRLSTPCFGHQPSHQELQDVYRPRLAYELSVLKALEFSGYFLLVHDIVAFAKSAGILVGPGRGSISGSLVAYLMGITDCDPIRFELMFERFINPDRIDLPDADLDFMSERRHEIAEYLINKYGADKVAGVSNYISLGSKSVIRDVGKAFGNSEGDYRCSKAVPSKHGNTLSLTDAMNAAPEVAAYAEKFPEIWAVGLHVEDRMKTIGKHAAGMVVSGCPLIERGVVERRNGENVISWDKRVVEDQGLIKMDILGLSTLDLLDLALKYIRRRHSSKINLLNIPLDDPDTLDNFAKANTIGVFQFESGGARRLLRELGKGGFTFDDVVAAVALYRPGPMETGMMDSYWKRKQGEEAVEYDHPLMEPFLKPTYGVMVFQEQVMKAAIAVAGYSAPDADKLRKIMGKKQPAEMAKERDKFQDGCVAEVYEIVLATGGKARVYSNKRYSVDEGGDYFLSEIEENDYSISIPLKYV
jgi:DNA polymerase-3 subunit alpha